MAKKDFKKGEIAIYKSAKGPDIKVHLEKETIWLTQEEISRLFDSERSVITKHLRNIFQNGELKEKSNVHFLHIPNSDKPVKFYNLDAVISVGYRVNSQKATQFRIWATKTLKNYLVKGYVINEKRLLDQGEKLNNLQQTISFLQEKSKHQLLSGQEGEILNLLKNYSKTLTLLGKYDKKEIFLKKGGKGKFILNYKDAISVILAIRKDLSAKREAGDLFGQEYESKFQGILGNIYQTFGGKELYPSIEEKAAHFLYFAVKDHPFVDGNKRIASFLFVYFLELNRCLYKDGGERKINDNALTVLTLLIAVSDPKEKDVMIKLITNLIN
jgi:prophage maintenance system killer protein